MPTRIIALVLLGLFMGFAALMSAVTLFVRDPLPLIGPNQTLVLQSAQLNPPVRSAVMIDGAYRVELTLEDATQPPVQARLRPAGGAPIPIETGANADGAYSGTGQLTRPGRWELVLSRGAVQEVLPFIVRE
jgi:hypothetical protein